MRISLTTLLILVSIFRIWGQQTDPKWLFEQLDLSMDSLKLELLASKEHPDDKGLTIWCFPHLTEYDCDGECWISDLFVVLTKSDKEIVAYNRFESALISDAVYPTNIWVDTAPYYISQNERAFGIRIEFSNNSRATGYSGEEFLLMIAHDHNVRQLLKVNSKTSVAYGGGDCQDTEVHHQESLFMIDKEHVINDHYSIIENIKYQHYFLTEDCEEGKKDIKRFKNIFQFENGEYHIQGQRQTGQ